MYVQSATPFILVALYFCCVIFLSVRATLKARRAGGQTFEDYYTGGKSMPGLIVALIVLVTFYSGTTFTGRVGFTNSFGFAGMSIIPTCTIVGLVMYYTCQVIWPISKKYRLSTLSDLLELRYQTKALKIMVALTIVGFNLIWLILEIRTLGYIFNVATGGLLPHHIAGLLAFALIVGYVVTGGIKSVASVDSFSALVMLFGSFIAVVYIMATFFGGSLTGMFAVVAQARPEVMVFNMDGEFGWKYWVTIVFIEAIALLIYPSNFMEICLAKSVKEAKKTSIATAFSGPWLIIFVILGFSSIGIQALGFPIAHPESSLMEVAKITGSGLFLGICTTFIFAATLGTVDSTLIALSGLISNDVIVNARRIKNREPNIGQDGDEMRIINDRVTRNAKKEIWTARATILTLSAVAYLLSLRDFSLMIMMIAYASCGLAQVVPLAVGALWWKKATPQAAIISFCVGVISLVVFDRIGLNLGGFVVGFPALFLNAVCFVIISLATFAKYKQSPRFKQSVYDDFFVPGRVDDFIAKNFK